MPEKVLLACIEPHYATQERIDLLERYAGGRRVVISIDRSTIESVLPDIEIAFARFPFDLLARAPNLKWYQQFGTGVDWLQRHPEAKDLPFILTNCSDDHCAVVSDHLFAMILTISRNIAAIVRAQDEGAWRPNSRLDDKDRFQLRGKTMLVAGLGSIGREIANRANAFGMELVGIRKDPSKPFEGIERIYGIDNMDTILPEVDIVASSLPYTDETRNLFGQSFFSRMKRSAYFFNIGRGPIVDEQALIAALRNGDIAGAGLDVFVEEPLPDASPLWNTPNLLVSPHKGGAYDGIFDTWIEIGLDNLKRYSEGGQLRNLVDKSIGY